VINLNKRQKKKYGFPIFKDCEVWDLAITLANYILPRLKRFKKVNVNSHPCNLSGIEEWHEIIDKMIWSFERIVNDDWSYETNRIREQKEQYEEGMNLFAKWFLDLWD
jgi:hypothetical protein